MIPCKIKILLEHFALEHVFCILREVVLAGCDNLKFQTEICFCDLTIFYIAGNKRKLTKIFSEERLML